MSVGRVFTWGLKDFIPRGATVVKFHQTFSAKNVIKISDFKI